MALAATGRGSGTNAASANPLNVSPSGNFAAGSSGVLCVTADNASSGGSTNDFASSMTDSLGNTWTLRQAPIFDNGAASAGIQGAIYTSPCSSGAPTTGTTIPISTGVAAAVKGWSLYEITKAANAEVAYVTGGVNTGATSSAPTVTTSSIPVGDLVVGAYHSENVGATTQDGDSTNGSWSAQVTVTAGSTTSGIRHSTQTKVQTTTASTQTFNPTTAGTQDCILSWIQLHEQHTATAQPALTGGGVLATSLATARSRGAAAATGGGVTVATETSAHTAAPVLTGGGVVGASIGSVRASAAALTGGGVVVASPTAGRATSTAATGGGTVAIDYDRSVDVENHDATFTSTGGGAVVATATSGRSATPIGAAGGVVAIAATSTRSGSAASTGAGVGTVASSSARSSSPAATGAGTTTLSLSSARQLAALLSGGGVLAAVPTSGRASTVQPTGAGVVVVDGTQEHVQPSASQTMTGGGVASVTTITARAVSAAATGSGTASASIEAARQVAVAFAGGGLITVGISADHRVELAAGGAGTLTVASELTGLPLSDDVGAAAEWTEVGGSVTTNRVAATIQTSQVGGTAT